MRRLVLKVGISNTLDGITRKYWQRRQVLADLRDNRITGNALLENSY